MTLANCKHCGELFIKSKTEYCGSCQSIQDRYYMQVREYLRSHPKSTVMDIHNHTGIPISKLLELGKEDYIPFGR